MPLMLGLSKNNCQPITTCQQQIAKIKIKESEILCQ